mmetsp:Transcript_46883/g.112360  ORF Transcript_46883/g.112360 Transcript_46883/m.112360 type:complete len:122 (-) Transcript_46883:8-373(-)
MAHATQKNENVSRRSSDSAAFLSFLAAVHKDDTEAAAIARRAGHKCVARDRHGSSDTGDAAIEASEVPAPPPLQRSWSAGDAQHDGGTTRQTRAAAGAACRGLGGGVQTGLPLAALLYSGR